MASNPFDQFDSAAQSYDTQLDSVQEKSYRTWMNRIGHTKAAGYRIDDNFSGQDYDYRGFFQKNGPVAIGHGQHFPDEFKKPAHETFSNESRYAVGEDAAKAGSWSGETFQPASGNPFDQFDAAAPASAAQAQQPGLLDRTVGLAASQHPLLAGMGEVASHAGSSVLAGPLAGLAGIVGTLVPGQRGQGADVTEAVQGGMTYQPRTPLAQGMQKLGGFLPGLIAKGGDVTGQAVSDVTGSPALGAATNTAVQMAPALLLRGRAGKMVENVNSRITAPTRAARPAAAAEETSAAAERQPGLASVSKNAPSLDKLRTDKSAAYKRAEDAGVQLSEFSFKKLKGKVLSELGERVDPTLHPDTTAALKRIVETRGAISLEKLDGLRQIANDAKGSVKPADQRLAGKIVDSIDEHLDGISAKDITRGDPKGVAALKEARDLNTRLKKGEQLEELFRRAEIKAGANYTQSGMENALRSEFKALALDAKKLRRFTPEERTAITRVAKGAPLENALRFVGKFAPAGPIAAAVATFLGGSVGGPMGAAAVGGALGARYAATRMTMRNASRASELVRRGRNALAEEVAKPKKRNALAEPLTY